MEDDNKRKDRDAWKVLLLGLARTWADVPPDPAPVRRDDGERFLRAARAVARNT